LSLGFGLRCLPGTVSPALSIDEYGGYCYNPRKNPGLEVMAIQLEYLKNITYFAGIDSAELESISRHVFEKAAERGEIIIFEGEPAKALYFVVSGVVKVFKTSADGKEQILRLVRPGESFNDVPVLSDGANLAGAEAMGSVVVYGIEKSELEKVLRDYHQVARNTIEVLSERVRQLTSLVEDLSFRQVTVRVARILLEHAANGGTPGHRLTQQEMAAMAGTAREMVGRSLKSLEEEGIIKLDHHRIVITDKKALMKMAEVSS